MNTNDLKNRIENWKTSIEHLNVQLNLGKDEAKIAFEQQKKNLNKWIISLDETIKKNEKIGKAKSIQLLNKVEDLKVQATLGKAETQENLKNQQEIISNKVNELKQDFKIVYNNAENDVTEKLEEFQTQFDLFKLHLHLGQKDAGNIWENKKVELSRQINEFKTKLDSNKHITSNNIDNFSKEIKETWEHLQNAFKHKKMK